MAGEKNFENHVKAWLDVRGIWHVKFFANRNTRAGVPDILACVNGRFLGIEVKGPRGQPSVLQLYNCREIVASGGIAVIAWPDDFCKLKELVDILQKGGTNEDASHVVFPRGHVFAMPDEVQAALSEAVGDAV